MFNKMNNSTNDSITAFIKMLLALVQQDEWATSPLRKQNKSLNVDDVAQLLYVIIKDEFCADVKRLCKNAISVHFDSGETFSISVEKTYSLDSPPIYTIFILLANIT